MIVPMKKISLITLGDKKEETLKKLGELGIVDIEISEASSEKLNQLKDNIALLKNALFTIGKSKSKKQKELDSLEVLALAKEIALLSEEKTKCHTQRAALSAELQRLKKWGDIDPESILELRLKGVDIGLYEMPKSEYLALPESIKTVRLASSRSSVKFLAVRSNFEAETLAALEKYLLSLPKVSCLKMRNEISAYTKQIGEIEEKISSYASSVESIKKEIKRLEKEVEFETYCAGMAEEKLSMDESRPVSVAYFKGYIEKDNLPLLKKTATDNSWGLIADEPGEEDNVPTKLKNNKFVSLIYPVMDFLGTVPGYYEYDISGWFLAFILVFFGIIFGDGGYGLLICLIALIPILKSLFTKKPIAPAFLLIGLFGLSTVVWGALTCTWFGLSPELLPKWLKSLSIPLISNVYADKIWTAPWMPEGAGLTTTQNLQIFCFSLALVQLIIAHIKCAVRNRKSLKILGDIGSIFQLIGIFYLVLSFVVNGQVFSMGLKIGGVPIGIVSLALTGVGFVLTFVFANYSGSIKKSIIASLKNIVSVLLGVVNVFSDIVSYIRLWAVGLAGAAISVTVNELVGPLFGNFLFMIFAIVIMVFGHGLNMILNVLSVIVHGIRLNTLEFSSHLDITWSGHKFKPFIN